MPNTKIFIGRNICATTYGTLTVSAKTLSDTADICFTDKRKNKTYGSVKVVELSQLQKLPIFRAAANKDPEKLIQTWQTKVIDDNIFKFSPNSELAIAFRSTTQVAENFAKLHEGVFASYGLEYFREVEFVKILAQRNQTVTSLKSNYGMPDARIKLLANHFRAFNSLLTNGITLNQIDLLTDEKIIFLLTNEIHIESLVKIGLSITQIFALDEKRIKLLAINAAGLQKLLLRGITLNQINSLDLNILETVLNSYQIIDQVLPFVSIAQIMGVSHIPPAIGEIGALNREADSYIVLDDTAVSTFTRRKSGDKIEFVHNDKTTSDFSTLKISCTSPSDEEKEQLDNQINSIQREQLVHAWYLLSKQANAANATETVRYCPQLNLLVKKTCDANFPVNKFNLLGYDVLAGADYYREHIFKTMLSLSGTSLDAVQNLKGMTRFKLEIIFKYDAAVNHLLDIGMTFADFANTEQTRLEFILSNYATASLALRLVDPAELFGLNQSNVNHTPTMWRASPTPKSEPITHKLEARPDRR